MATGTCQVCGFELGDEPVETCDACSTPHHSVCWQYLGGCSTFACQGTRSHDAASTPALDKSPLVIEGDDPGLVVVPSFYTMSGVQTGPLARYSEVRRTLYYDEAGRSLTEDWDQPAVQIPSRGLDLSGLIRRAPAVSAWTVVASGVFAGLQLPVLICATLMASGVALLYDIVRVADAAWIRRLPAGDLVIETAFRRGNEVHRGRPISLPSGRHRVRLVSRYHVIPTSGGRLHTARLFFLELVLGALDPHVCGLATQVIPLAPVIHTPPDAGLRPAFLRALHTLRVMGQQVAQVLEVPYMEAPWTRQVDSSESPALPPGSGRH